MDLVYRFQVTYNEIIDYLDLKYIPTKRTGYSLNPGIYEITDINKTLEEILRHNVKIKVTIDNIRLKSNLKIIQTLIFTEKSFFYTNLGFKKSHSYPLNDIDGFYQLLAGSYKSEKTINITRIDKNHSKSDCFNGSILNGLCQLILFRFALDKPLGHEIYKEPRNKPFKKINKPVRSHITFYLEDDSYKAVNFNIENISFTCHYLNYDK